MKRNLMIKGLLLPIVLSFVVGILFLGTAAIGEHRYAIRHPKYASHALARLVGEEAFSRASDDWSDATVIPTGGGGGVTNILVMGRDAAAGLTDVMMLVSLDGDAHTLNMLQIPRDTYANYTGKPYKKINGAYRTLGGEGATEFVAKHMGIHVDRYVCVDLSVFGEIVDKLGGVRMEVPADMDYDDPAQGLHIHLKKGEQILDGTQAQMFVRYRSGYTRADLGRMDAQKLFLASLAKQMKSTLTFKRAAELACSCFGKVKTNMTMRECVSCVRMLMDVELDAMQMATLVGQDVRPSEGGAWYYILNRKSARQQVEQLLGSCGEFDPDGVFTNPKKPEYQSIYLSEDGRFSEKARSAKDLIEGEFAPARIS